MYHQNWIHPVGILIPIKLAQFVEVAMEKTMSCVKIEASWGLLSGEEILECRDMLSPVLLNLVLGYVTRKLQVDDRHVHVHTDC
jgi:hypothetical protein